MLAFAPVCAVPVTGARHRATSRRPTVSASLVSPAAAARERLLELIRPSSKGGDVGKALQELMNVAPEPGVAPGWESVMSGRWGLRHTTEPPLARLLELGETKSYQLFRVGDVVENVIEFSTPAVLCVGCEYVAREKERGFDFDFQTTRLLVGGPAKQFMGEEGGFGIDLKVPFAVGKGFVQLVWLDHVLRIDKSRLGGKDVVNVYVYEGPVDKCKVRK